MLEDQGSPETLRGEAKSAGSLISVMAHEAQLRHFMPLVERGSAQTHARALQGNPYVAGKVLSVFEPHTQAIRKGKAHKPTEFGRLVRLDEGENGVVSRYEVLQGNPADASAWSRAGAAPAQLRPVATPGDGRSWLVFREEHKTRSAPESRGWRCQHAAASQRLAASSRQTERRKLLFEIQRLAEVAIRRKHPEAGARTGTDVDTRHNDFCNSL